MEGRGGHLRSPIHEQQLSSSRLDDLRDDAPMTQHNSTSSIGWLSRRRAILLGAGATAGALAGLAPRPAAAVLHLDVTQGNVQPIPIALPDFVGTGLSAPETAHDVSQIIASN